ncbi:unnamed protein product [Trichobilharzia regenti]|nr:unnamed protein product [Trichobilharzia regenti]
MLNKKPKKLTTSLVHPVRHFLIPLLLLSNQHHPLQHYPKNSIPHHHHLFKIIHQPESTENKSVIVAREHLPHHHLQFTLSW